jgi:hypothetical protein
MPRYTQAEFDHIVNNADVSDKIKADAIAIEAAVWADDRLPCTITSAHGSLQFTEQGTKLTADLNLSASVEPPSGLLHTQMDILKATDAFADTYVGAGSYWIESHAFGNDLRLGASVGAHGLFGVSDVTYGKADVVAILTTPTRS